jgi:tetratricopeptide (TPR) repeat protein
VPDCPADPDGVDRADDETAELDALWNHLPRTAGEERAEVLDQIGGLLVQRGKHADALTVVESARTLYEELGAVVDVARCDHNAGVILAELHRMEESVERYRLAAERYGATLCWSEAATSWRAVADLLADAGDDESALAALRTASQLHADADEPVRAALTRMELGELLLDVDRAVEARAELEGARQALRADGALLWVARCDQLLAEVARTEGRWAEAFELVEAAHAVFDAADMDGDRDRCDDLWCSVLIDAGRSDEAIVRLERARRTRQSDGDPVGVAWCDLHLSRALDRLGDPEGAARHRRRARAVFDAAGLDTLLRRRELAVRSMS